MTSTAHAGAERRCAGRLGTRSVPSWGRGPRVGALGPFLIHPPSERNCPKSLGRARSVARRVAKERGFSVYFTLRIAAKSTLGALLVPLFGQFQRDCMKSLGGDDGVVLRRAKTPLFQPLSTSYTGQIRARDVARPPFHTVSEGKFSEVRG